MGVFCAGGQLQIILGTGTVNRVYEEFIKLSGLPGAPAAQKCTAPVLPLPQRLVKTLGDVFVPILPAIVAAGLLTGILDALGRALPAVAAADWFNFLKMVSGTAFVSLPVLVALSSARVFGGNLSSAGWWDCAWCTPRCSTRGLWAQRRTSRSGICSVST